MIICLGGLSYIFYSDIRSSEIKNWESERYASKKEYVLLNLNCPECVDYSQNKINSKIPKNPDLERKCDNLVNTPKKV